MRTNFHPAAANGNVPGEKVHPRSAFAERLEAERRRHEAYASGRRYGYVPRNNTIAQLDAFMGSDKRRLVICAPSGAGKSALMAHWMYNLPVAHPGFASVQSHVGSGHGDPYGVMHHVMMEIKALCDVPDELPVFPDVVDSSFSSWLAFVQHQPLVIMLDGIDQLRGGAGSLSWLRRALPSTIRLIVTTTDESAFEELGALGWERMRVEPLTPEERNTIVQQFVAGRSTRLNPAQLRGIAGDAGSSNPLLLRTRLEEVHRSTTDGDADRTIEYFLGAQTLDELFERVLIRLEGQVGRQSAEDVLALLVASRGGLSEQELVEITGLAADRVTAVVRSIECNLMVRDGAFCFYHTFIRDTARRRYLPEEENARSAHERLARYFETSLGRTGEGGDARVRGAVEFAYQISRSMEPHDVAHALARIDVTTALVESDHLHEFLGYWNQPGVGASLESAYHVRLRAYRDMEPSGEALAEALDAVAGILHGRGAWDAAEQLYREELEIAERNGNRGRTAAVAGLIGKILRQKGEHEPALEMFQLQSSASDALGDRRQKAIALGNIGMVLTEQGRFRAALEYHQEQLAIAEDIGNERQIVKATAGVANLYDQLGDLDAALRLYERVRTFSERSNDWRLEAHVAGMLGRIKQAQGDDRAALEHFHRKLEIAREVGDRRQIAIAMGNMGLAHVALEEHEAALECYGESLAIAEELGYKRQVEFAAGGLALVHTMLGAYDDALRLAEYQRMVAEELGDRKHVATATVTAATVFARTGERTRALEVVGHALAMHMEIGYRYGLADVLLLKGRLLFEEAETSHEPHAVESRLEMLRDALRCIDECSTIAAVIGREEVRFAAVVLRERILYVQQRDPGCIERLTALLSGELSDARRAMVLHTRAIVVYAAGASDDVAVRAVVRDDLLASMRLYEELYRSTRNAEYAERRAELLAFMTTVTGRDEEA